MIKKLPARLEFLLEENSKDWNAMSLNEKIAETDHCIWMVECELEEYGEDYDSKEKSKFALSN